VDKFIHTFSLFLLPQVMVSFDLPGLNSHGMEDGIHF